MRTSSGKFFDSRWKMWAVMGKYLWTKIKKQKNKRSWTEESGDITNVIGCADVLCWLRWKLALIRYLFVKVNGRNGNWFRGTKNQAMVDSMRQFKFSDFRTPHFSSLLPSCSDDGWNESKFVAPDIDVEQFVGKNLNRGIHFWNSMFRLSINWENLIFPKIDYWFDCLIVYRNDGIYLVLSCWKHD